MRLAPLLLTSLPLLLLVAPAGAQVRNFTVDAYPLGGALGLGWRAAPGTYVGLALGVGPNSLSKSFHPRDEQTFHDFEQFLYLDVFVRRKPGSRVDVDLGVRGGLGDVRVCTASDCLPGAYAGVFAAVFVGSARWKLGTRVIGGRVWEPHLHDDVLHWDVITLRYSR